MTAFVLPQGKQNYETATGAPAVGWKLYTTDTGTNNPRLTWLDSAQITPNANPVVMDARGEAVIFWSGAYRVRLEDNLGNTIWTVDGVSYVDPTATLLTDLATFNNGAKGAGMVGFGPAVTYNANTVGSFLNSIYARTAAEIAAGVTPTNYFYPQGNVLRYGTNSVPGTTDMTTAIQAALNVVETPGGDVFIPQGTYKVTARLEFGSGTHLYGVGYDSLIQATVNGPIFRSKGGTVSRRYRLHMHDIGIDGTSKVTYPASVGVSLRNATQCLLENIFVFNCGDGFDVHADPGLGAYYNTLIHCNTDTTDIAFYCSTGANETRIIDGRTTVTVNGLWIEDNSNTSALNYSCENFVTGVNIRGTAFHAMLVGTTRLENEGAYLGTGTGILIAAAATESSIDWPYYVSLLTNLNDTSTTTSYKGPDGRYFGGGTKQTGHFHVTVNRDVANLAAGGVRQEGPITVTGVRVGDAVAVALPAAWGNIQLGGVIVTANNTLFLQLYNPTGGAIDPPAGDFQFTWDRH